MGILKPSTYYIVVLLLGMCLVVPVMAQQQSYGSVKVGDQIALTQSCINSTYSNITRIIAPNKSFVIDTPKLMVKNGDDYSYNFNITDDGSYFVYGKCDENSNEILWQYDVIATPNGENPTTATAIFYIGIFVVILFIFGLSVYLFIEFDSLLTRVASIGLAYLSLTAVSFIAWNMANDFITSSPFLVSILKNSFFILMWSALPLLILGIVYYFLSLWKIKEIERLMTKGFSMEEAERRVKKR